MKKLIFTAAFILSITAFASAQTATGQHPTTSSTTTTGTATPITTNDAPRPQQPYTPPPANVNNSGRQTHGTGYIDVNKTPTTTLPKRGSKQ
jgi:hypothetical protein